MEDIEVVKSALREHYNKYGISGEGLANMTSYLEGVMNHVLKGEYEHITRDNGARQSMIDLGKKRIVTALVKNYFENIPEFMGSYGVEEENSRRAARKKNRLYREAVSEAIKNIMSGNYEKLNEMVFSITSDFVIATPNIKNVRMASGAYKILSGVGEDVRVRGEVELDGTTFAVTDIGRERKNQEDALLIMSHPDNPDFKIMVVADGMGGCYSGEIASDIAVKMAKEWFEKLSVDMFDDPSKVVNNLSLPNLFIAIDRAITKKIGGPGQGGTTFSCAIVGRDNTLICNVGDSRVYSTKGGELCQITEDDSQVYDRWVKGEISLKDDIRFATDSNFIKKALGLGKCDTNYARYYKMNNLEYDSLILTSDGVTDCISDAQIKAICIGSTSAKDLARNIVDTAKNNTSFAREGLKGDSRFYQQISPGKDNATAVVYNKSNRNKYNDYGRGM